MKSSIEYSSKKFKRPFQKGQRVAHYDAVEKGCGSVVADHRASVVERIQADTDPISLEVL